MFPNFFLDSCKLPIQSRFAHTKCPPYNANYSRRRIKRKNLYPKNPYNIRTIRRSLATHLQRAPTSGAMLPQNWLQQPTGGGIQSNQSLQACQQKLRLQSLQMERERLKQRQQEIIRQVSIGGDPRYEGEIT